ncbi:Ribose-phosphate pyrophosphokinase 5 [Zancudomyces culisetae]|uniref:ribose-phosphate diphosphokinase n=1 Tax=Zancudomyces culisetae TaxID=1213189 RepID=A0A1R1PZ74_ZANCU|nr:Ribose-phosphate pyrophosphokinase 5 [Zancudomyces culisetae]|eukprot:OMH86250.1 Ribose-phosphate pyrophosphokinase 5 [Zancudomyces culisetae]
MGSARRISVVTPLFPYSRQSKLSQRRRLLKSHANEPTEEIEGLKTGYKSWAATSGTLIASLIQESGADHLIVMDLHEPQYQGFFTIPVDSVYAEPVIINYIKTSIPNWRSAVVVSPTAGGAKRATSISNKLHLQFALVHNAGDRYQQESEAVGLVGDVTDRVTIMIDDMIDTASTMLNASKMLKAHGAKEIHVIVIHGIFSSDSIDKINKSSIDTIACTNSVPQDDFRSLCPKLQTIDVSTILGETIRRSFNGESVTKLYEYDEY